MRKLYSLLLFILFCNTSYSQSLTLNELFNICNKSNWIEVNDFMLKRGWVFYESKKGDDEHYSTITWSYNKKIYEDKAEAWFHVYTYNEVPCKIMYSFFNKPSYSTIKNGIGISGMVLNSSSIENDELLVRYTNSGFNLELVTSKQKPEGNISYYDNSVISYQVKIIKKSSIYDPANGKKLVYDSLGNLTAEFTLKNGKFNGLLKQYYPNGNFKSLKNFVNGIQQGLEKEFDEEGNIETEHNYLNGEVDGLIRIYENGRVIIDGLIKNGQANGMVSFFKYDENGVLDSKSVGNYKDSLMDGLWKKYYVRNGRDYLVDSLYYLKGQKEGYFFEYRDDTTKMGFYKEGVLNGSYKALVRDVVDSITHFILCSGDYSLGEKTGKWQILYDKYKVEEGYYNNDFKSGMWTKYVVLGRNKGKILSVTNFKNGIEDSVFKQYFNDDEAPIDETINYKEGIKEGEYLLKDSNSKIVCKGNYIQGNKSGLWIEGKLIGNKYYYQSGEYDIGRKNGNWIDYYDKENPLFLYHYRYGHLDGKSIKYNSNNKPKEEIYYKTDILYSIDIYDESGSKIIRSFNMPTVNYSEIECTKKELDNDREFTQEFIVPKLSQMQTISSDIFQEYFWDKSIPHGTYKLFDKDGLLIIKGLYHRGYKDGKWNYYYKDLPVYSVKESDVDETEKFLYLKDDKPYSGKLVVKYPNGKTKFNFKISKGVRNGKSKYYDMEGKLFKTENYHKGVLK